MLQKISTTTHTQKKKNKQNLIIIRIFFSFPFTYIKKLNYNVADMETDEEVSK